MSARDLDFEEVSLLRERSAMLKDGYKTYLQSHPELTQLLGDLVSSCLVHRPEDVFDHAASHFGGKRVDVVARSWYDNGMVQICIRYFSCIAALLEP